MDHRLTILVSSFLRTAGQTRGSPVSQRATEHRNDTPRLPDDNNQQRTPLSTTKTQQHFIRLTCATWKPAFNPRIQRQRCTDQTSSIPDDPLSWQTPASSLAGTRLPPLPLPTTFTRIPPFNVIAIASIDDTQETRCVLCLYLWPMQHRVIYTRLFGKQKRLPVKSTPLFGTTELDQGEANVCIWQDTNKAKEVPFKKKNIVDWNMEGGKAREKKLKV